VYQTYSRTQRQDTHADRWQRFQQAFQQVVAEDPVWLQPTPQVLYLLFLASPQTRDDQYEIQYRQ
jgi:hypothetical protein